MADVEFSGGITNPEQALEGTGEVYYKFSGGIRNQIQALAGVMSWPFSGGITNPGQGIAGIIQGFEVRGGIANAVQAISGTIRQYYAFSGGITNPIQRIHQAPPIIELTIIPENAVGFVNGEYTDIFRAGTNFLLITDPWWLEVEDDPLTLWVDGGVQTVTVEIPKEVVTEIPPPPDDGRIYAMINGEWVDITDSLINPPL